MRARLRAMPAIGSNRPISPDSSYIDPTVCAGCHPNILETYRRTGMGRSFYRPTLDNTIGDSGRTATFYRKASGSYFTMLERGGRFF